MEPALTNPEKEGFGLTEEVLRKANNRPTGSLKISRATIYSWLNLRLAHGVPGLAPTPPKVADPLPPGFVEFLKFYARPQKPNMTEALKDYLESGPKDLLTIDQVGHALRKKLNGIERHVGREGLLTLRSRLAYIQRDTSNLLPTTIYTADGKTFDAEIADPVQGHPCKPEITSILDVATRKCVSFALSRKENASCVAEALRTGCVDHGIPAMFYTDRGAGYKNRRFDDAVLGLIGRLSITKMHALPYNSQAKGIIERFNKIWNPLAQRLPTYLGAPMDKEAGWVAHKRTRADIKAFGQSSLLPSWEDFRAMCAQAIADYNAKPHESLPKIEDPVTGKTRHMSPDEAWAQHVSEGFEPVMVDAESIDDLFRPYEVRVASRALVQWNTNTYFHMALEPYHGTEVAVGYDENQANFVWVREYDREADQPGRFICKAEFGGNKQAYVPLTAQRAAEEKRAKGAIKRIDKKRDAITDGLDGPFQLEHLKAAPMPDLTIVATAPIKVAAVGPTPPSPAARLMNPDVEIALKCLADPTQLTPGRRKLLLDFTAGRAGREFLRISGVDLDALEDLLRSAA
jgi:putative transposase